MQRVLIFVDEANFSMSAREFQARPDFKALAEFLADPAKGRNLIEMVVYLGFPPTVKEENMPENWKRARDRKHKLRDAIEFMGFMTVSRSGKFTQDTDSQGQPIFSSNVDVIMAMDVVEFALDANPDLVVLVTGDADFAHLAGKLRRRGIRVEAASTRNGMSTDLQKSVNRFVDLAWFFQASQPSRPPYPRAERYDNGGRDEPRGPGPGSSLRNDGPPDEPAQPDLPDPGEAFEADEDY